MSDFVQAVGLVLVLEGLLYAAFPVFMLRMLEQVRTMPPGTLRLGGLASAVVGLVILYFVRM